MADHLVDRSTTLERFLVSIGVQPWRIPILVQTKGVLVFRNQAPLAISDPKDRLQDQDWVRIVDPPSSATQAALSKAATGSAMDFGFAPGATAFDLRMQSVLKNRTKTILISDPMIDSLSAFVSALGKRPPLITAPINHLVIASHANPEGYLFLKMGLLDANQITYEDLEAAVKSKSLMIDPAWLAPRPKDAGSVDIPPLVLIRGCRIGNAPAYLGKLREALGGGLAVVAPRHFHVAAAYRAPAGALEYMETGWSVFRPGRLKDRAAVITAFQGAGHLRVDGSPVPARDWDGFIPSNPHQAAEQAVRAFRVNPIDNRRIDFPARFRFRIERIWKDEQSFALKKDPGPEADRKAAILAELKKTYPQYLETHPFPVHARFGYASVQDFMDGYTWNTRYEDGTLFFKPSRAAYYVMQPIADVSTNRVFMNFYPSNPRNRVIETLPFSDARFFAQV